MIITLTSDELVYIKSIAEQRFATARLNGFKNRADNGSDLHGFAAEYAVSKFLNREINTLASNTNLDAPDVGLNIDVKSARYKSPGNLVINVDQFKDNRIYCLAYTEDFPNSVELVGWQTSEAIKNNCAIKINRIYGHKIMVYFKEELRPIAELIDYINI